MESRFKLTPDNFSSYKFYFSGNSPIDITPLNEMRIKNILNLNVNAGFDLVIIDVWEKEFIPVIPCTSPGTWEVDFGPAGDIDIAAFGPTPEKIRSFHQEAEKLEAARRRETEPEREAPRLRLR